jgi:hypothetical protein
MTLNKFSKILQIGVGFSLLTVALGFLTSRPAPAQAPPPSVPVTVVNATARPVPTAAQGTTRIAGNVGASQVGLWNVGISGTPNVAASQVGPWNVGISGTPNVAASITNPVSLAAGSISNTASTPLFVEDVGAAGRYPFALEQNNVGVNSGAFVILPSTTPSGGAVQTAVIEFVSAFCQAASGVALDHLNLDTVLAGAHSDYFLTTTGFGDGGIWMAQQVKIYASAGTTVSAGLPGNNTGCLLSVSGYLLPQ